MRAVCNSTWIRHRLYISFDDSHNVQQVVASGTQPEIFFSDFHFQVTIYSLRELEGRVAAGI